jgi:hypothetical protein
MLDGHGCATWTSGLMYATILTLNDIRPLYWYMARSFGVYALNLLNFSLIQSETVIEMSEFLFNLVDLSAIQIFQIYRMLRIHRLTRSIRFRGMESSKRKISQVDGTAGSVDKENKKKTTASPARQSSLLSMWGAKSTTDKDKVVSSLAVAKAPPISRSDLEKDLTEEQKTLLKLELDTLNPEWLRILKPELTKASFLKVCTTWKS